MMKKQLIAATCEIGTQKKSRKGRLKTKKALFITLCEKNSRGFVSRRLVVPA